MLAVTLISVLVSAGRALAAPDAPLSADATSSATPAPSVSWVPVSVPTDGGPVPMWYSRIPSSLPPFWAKVVGEVLHADRVIAEDLRTGPLHNVLPTDMSSVVPALQTKVESAASVAIGDLKSGPLHAIVPTAVPTVVTLHDLASAGSVVFGDIRSGPLHNILPTDPATISALRSHIRVAASAVIGDLRTGPLHDLLPTNIPQMLSELPVGQHTQTA